MTTAPQLAKGGRVVYLGTDEAIYGMSGHVVSLVESRAGDRCMARLDNGDLLDAAVSAWSAGAPADAVARARRVLEDRSSSQDALRGALRLLLLHIEEADAR